MELYYVLIIISVLTGASSKAFDISSNTTKDIPKSLALVKRNVHADRSSWGKQPDTVELPTYSIYLIGFTIIFMLIIIIGLSVALYLALKKKSMFGLNFSSKQYVRQESSGVTPLYNISIEEQNKNNGSTLTMNSGIIEISEPRASDPITPTRTKDTKIIFARKPLKPIVPVMHRGQMDAICKEVLSKVQKSDSASFRDLNDLLKFEKKGDNSEMSEDIQESEKENLNEEKDESNIEKRLFQLKKTPEIKKETQKEIKSDTQDEIKTEPKLEIKNVTTNKIVTEIKPDDNKDVRIEVNIVDSDKNEDDSDSQTEYDTVPSPIRFRHSGPEPDQTMYDTVPNPMKHRHSGPEANRYDLSEYPIRLRHSGPETDQAMYDTVPNPIRFRNSGSDSEQAMYDTVANPKRCGPSDHDKLSGIYDLPPTRSPHGSRNVIQMDKESHYLLPISTENTESCYINAKTHSP